MEDPRQPGAVRYVGVTHKTVRERLRDHIRTAVRGICRYHSSVWIRSLLAADVQPQIRIIQAGTGPDWDQAEIAWIAWHREQGHDLTNHTAGGEGTLGVVVSEETRRKQSLAKVGRPRSPEAIERTKATMADPAYRARHAAIHRGKTPSEETRQRRSAAMKGRTQSAEHVAKRAASNRGKKRSDEVRAKFSAQRKGKPVDPLVVAKRAASNRGKKRSPEFREKMRAIAISRNAKVSKPTTRKDPV